MKRKRYVDPMPDEDKLDGLKAIGCLLAGIILIAIFVSVTGYLISQIR